MQVLLIRDFFLGLTSSSLYFRDIQLSRSWYDCGLRLFFCSKNYLAQLNSEIRKK
jgi:hypothetical protein